MQQDGPSTPKINTVIGGVFKTNNPQRVISNDSQLMHS